MKNINIAFKVFSDPEKRNQYDKTNFDNITQNKDKINDRYEGTKILISIVATVAWIMKQDIIDHPCIL